ncbi:hypothetical protein DFJ58DRAFT_129948 [Suillus subalutaceus]|uniref:uncharacterized protein n=1 Tax=Suillus subalutaceus TaxID=48586 RepID=UPI001B880A83|nr:uncharacterized protein DFJ58DRAFT_129948 [Suillus subalutaceus]KAG1867261.1 hypothetical protein DFJ58DRAFT_129948 [Suillus subalutaceus]
MGLFSGLSRLFFDVGILSWDVLLTLSNQSSHTVAATSRLSRLATTSGQPTTSVLPFAHLCRTSPLICSRKATARIHLI